MQHRNLKQKGFKLVEAPTCREFVGHTAGNIVKRAATINEFFADNSIAGLLSFWGGNQSHQLLEYLDYEVIRRNPKVFVGYSDTTSLQNGITHKTGLVTFSGPAALTFCKPHVFPYTWDCFERVLMGGISPLPLTAASEWSDTQYWLEPDKRMKLSQSSGWKTYSSGVATGRSIGGNLGTLLNLAGTEYWPDCNGKIFFIEDDESESSRSMDRMFTQLRHMGVYDQVKGLVIGRFHSKVGFTPEDSLAMILDDALKGYDLPVMYDVDFGHTDPILTIPLGINCKLDTDRKEITYLEPAVE